MTFANHPALPWTAAIAGALALNGAVLWGLQKALAPVPDVVMAPVIQVVMVGAAASPQKVAAPISASAGPVARPVARSRKSRAAARAATPLVTQATIRVAVARTSQPQPAPAQSTPLPNRLAQTAQPVSETTVAAGESTSVVARASAVAAPVAGDAGSGGSAGKDGSATAGGAAQGAVLLPSERAAYLNNPPPDYPPMSRLRGESGTPVIHVLIGVDGRAHAARIEKSSGYARLDDAALITARDRWRYRPGTRNGMPEAMWYDVPIEFVLR